ncbi:MAG: hypothetical protein ACD_19C00354G0004 [uncultured bacterium]|nr:MAG: hypothetical protein ACD_19C00354G0004 [uncultured bacterium]OGH14057.1 MAG: hypothetical protein A2687_02220 [Candidatus Levybacteria bacterium RIFCSPHIGHO2_01_FULL_38_26]
MKISNVQKGFTLVELLIVIAVVGILAAITTVSFVDYYQNQIVQTAASELVSTLNLAKSNALSQVKPPACAALDGYRVVIANGATYNLEVVCSGTPTTVNSKSLSSPPDFTGMIFPSSFLFEVLTGNVVNSGSSTINISGYGKTQSITVSSTGVVR